MKNQHGNVFSDLLFIMMGLSLFAGWVTSIWHSIATGDMIWLIVSIFLAPVGAFHGIWLWFV